MSSHQPVQQLKILWKLTLEEKSLLLWATFFLLIASGLTLYYPMITGQIIDLIKQPAENPKQQEDIFELITQKTMLLIFLFVMMGIATSFRAYLFTIAGERNIKRLRIKLFEHLLYQDIAFFDQSKSGEFLSRLNEDSTRIQQAISVNISMLLRYLLMTLGSFVILFWISVKLSLLMSLLVPTAAALAGWYGQKLRNISKAVQGGQAQASGVAQDALMGIRTIQSYTAEAFVLERYQRVMNEAFELASARAKFGAYFQGLMSVLAYISIAIVIWFGAKLCLSKALTLGELTSFLLYTFSLAFAVGALSSLWEDYMKAIGASEVIFELLEREPRMLDGELTLADNQIQGAVRFTDVAFAYESRPNFPIFKALSFEIKSKELVAIVGTSGAGKSTISSLISRFYDPTQGVISLDGIDLKSISLLALRKQIALVSQEPLLFATTIEENLRYADPNATQEALIHACRLANAHDFISHFPAGYQSYVGERGVQLSGGQKQRIAIARAILKNPKLLILDEATSALDTESERLVQEALEKLMKDRTTLMIAHRLSTVINADRILVLDQGEIVEQGTHHDLIESKGIYFDLVAAQLN